MKGFTLVELLVSISIIGILSAIAFVSYSRVLGQGRDSKRQADLRVIQSALEKYYADKFHYPASLTPGSVFSEDNKTYLEVPVDPTGNPEYLYVPSPTGSSYCLYAKLENSDPGLGSCTNTTYNFALTPP